MGTEIERKWVAKIAWFDDLNTFLKQHNVAKSHIIQFYTDNYQDVECRLRKEIFDGLTLHTITEKMGKGLTRTENEVKISETMFNSIFEMYKAVKAIEKSKANIIEKTRYCYVFDDDTIPTIYFDTYSKPIFVPFIIEVEFKHESEANRYDIEPILQSIGFPYKDLFEVTDRKDFKNRAISNNGFPFFDYVKKPYSKGDNDGFVIIYRDNVDDIYLEPHVNDRVLHPIEYYNNSVTYINSYLQKYGIPFRYDDFELDIKKICG